MTMDGVLGRGMGLGRWVTGGWVGGWWVGGLVCGVSVCVCVCGKGGERSGGGWGCSLPVLK